MKEMTSQELRKKWEKFWESKNHSYLQPTSLVSNKDSTALFNLAGMQQLIPYLSGKDHPQGDKLYNIQGCIRTNDIDEVGDDSHLTYFEMMGNWSLGAYFKKKSIEYSYEFLTDWLDLDHDKLAVTVFEGDENVSKDMKAVEIWKNLGIPDHKISYLDKEENWWEPGQVGPCGPDTEIFYRVGEDEYPSQKDNVKKNEDNWLELWNNVFMEYYNDGSRDLTKLDNQNVDTGMGFERIIKVLQGVDNVYQTDLFQGLLEIIQDLTGQDYEDNKTCFRIIADHFRSASLIASEDVIPSNTDRGYVLRRLIRRMYYNLFELKGRQSVKLREFLEKGLEFIKKKNQIELDQEKIIEKIQKECKQFQKTIDRGLDLLDDILQEKSDNELSGKQVFKLYDTYGFPYELTASIANEEGYKVDKKEFEKQMEKARKRSRQNSKDQFSKDVDWSKYIQDIQETEFVGYDQLSLQDCELIKEFKVDNKKVFIFDKTPFYPESGGQTGDTGILEFDDEKYEIVDVQEYGGVILHIVDRI